MVDAAFGLQTDPAPNEPEIFRDIFTSSGIIVNARIVGDPAVVAEEVKKLWTRDMKLIVVTYCQSPEDQQQAYETIHDICQ